MIITSLTVSFIPLAILSLQSQTQVSWRSNSFCKNVNIILVRCFLVGLGTLALNMTLKSFMEQTADNHIFQFVASWFGYTDITDFDTRLYHCLSIFKPLSASMYKALSINGALPMYGLYMTFQACFIALTVLKIWYVKEKVEDPEPKNGDQKNPPKKSLVQKLFEDEDLKFMVTMDQSPHKTYHIGKLKKYEFIFRF